MAWRCDDVVGGGVERFLLMEMQPLFGNGMGGGRVEMRRAEVMGFLDPRGFRDYCAEIRARKVMEGEGGGWRDARVPV